MMTSNYSIRTIVNRHNAIVVVSLILLVVILFHGGGLTDIYDNGVLGFAFTTPPSRSLILHVQRTQRPVILIPNGSGPFSSGLRSSIADTEFFFCEDDGKEEKTDNRMVNGSWSNKNQYPSKPPRMEEQQLQKQQQQQEEQIAPSSTTITTTAAEPQSLPPHTSPALPSFLCVDGNGTGGLMRRSRGTGGANPSLMIPSDVNPNMRMATPIDSGKEDRLRVNNTQQSTVASYAALSALTRVETSSSPYTSSSSSSTTTSPQSKLVPFQNSHRNRLADMKTTPKPIDTRSFHSKPPKIKVQRFNSENSLMDEYREGFSKPIKNNYHQKSLETNHHINVNGNNSRDSDNNNNKIIHDSKNHDIIANVQSQHQQRQTLRQPNHQHPQQAVPGLATPRLVPFTGSSLMEEITRTNNNNQNERRLQNAKLVKFNGHSMMEQERILEQNQQLTQQQQQESIMMLHRHKLVPYRKTKLDEEGSSKATSSYSSHSPSTSGGGKVVLYHKKAAVASSVVHSPKREYYYVQFRPPTDATLARKTGLQVNTPISLWNERDKFLDS